MGTLLACRLIFLDKSPSVKPIGVDEVLRRTIGKTVMNLAKNMLWNSHHICRCMLATSQVRKLPCTPWKIFTRKEKSEAVILVDLASASSNIKRKVHPYNIKVPYSSTFIYSGREETIVTRRNKTRGSISSANLLNIIPAVA